MGSSAARCARISGRAAGRTAPWSATRPVRADANHRIIADLATTPEAELDSALAGAEAVVHLAGRAHVLEETAPDPVASYRQANVVATARIAAGRGSCGRSASRHASTVKVHGEASAPGRPLRPEDPCVPLDDYARSKLAAEREIAALGAGTALAPLILRLPLVYGPGVKGNFLALMDAVARGATLPLGAIRNRRSILYVGNLVEAIAVALDTTPPPTGTHFVTDAQSVAVPDLARAIGVALGEPVRLPSVPGPCAGTGRPAHRQARDDRTPHAHARGGQHLVHGRDRLASAICVGGWSGGDGEVVAPAARDLASRAADGAAPSIPGRPERPGMTIDPMRP